MGRRGRIWDRGPFHNAHFHALDSDEKQAVLWDLGLWDAYKHYNLADLEITVMPFDEYMMMNAVQYCGTHLLPSDSANLNEAIHDFLNQAIKCR